MIMNAYDLTVGNLIEGMYNMSFIDDEIAKANINREKFVTKTAEEKTNAISTAEQRIADKIVSRFKIELQIAISRDEHFVRYCWYKETATGTHFWNKGEIVSKCTSWSLEEFINSSWGVPSLQETFEETLFYPLGEENLNYGRIQDIVKKTLLDLGVKRATVYIGYHDSYISKDKYLFITTKTKCRIVNPVKIYVEASW
jgi:hypothetical protein